MTRERLAADARCSYDYIRRLEGKNPPNPTLEISRRICHALGVTVDEAFPPVLEPIPAGKG